MEKTLSLNILKKSLLLFSLISVNFLFSQEYQHIKTIPIASDFIVADNFSNLYVIKDFRITLFDLNGEQQFVFEDYSNGKISQVDVTDPMKIIVYYKDFMFVRLLDKTLSDLSSFRLNNFGFDLVEAIGHTRDRKFWIYSQSDFKLKKIDDAGNVFNESELFNILFEEAINPTKIIEYEGFVYLLDEENGVYVFDQFGTYSKRIPLKNINYLQILQNKLIYFNGESLNSYDLNWSTSKEMPLPIKEDPILGVLLQKGRLFVQTKGKIHIFKY